MTSRSTPTSGRPQVPPGSVLSRHELRALGVGTRRLHSEEFTRVLPGHYTPTQHPAGVEAVTRAAVAHLRPSAVACSFTAAEILGLPLPRGRRYADGEPIHCAVAPEHRTSSARGLAIHQRTATTAVTVHGVPCAEPVGVVVSLMGSLSVTERVACIDALTSRLRERKGLPRITTAQFSQRLSTISGRGVALAREALVQARDGVDSPQETRARLILVRAGLPEPETNLRILDPDTGQSYWLDLAYREARIAIEYDGWWHESEMPWRRDRYKDELLRGLGWMVYRITARDLAAPKAFVRRVEAALRRANARV